MFLFKNLLSFQISLFPLNLKFNVSLYILCNFLYYIFSTLSFRNIKSFLLKESLSFLLHDQLEIIKSFRNKNLFFVYHDLINSILTNSIDTIFIMPINWIRSRTIYSISKFRGESTHNGELQLTRF